MNEIVAHNIGNCMVTLANGGLPYEITTTGSTAETEGIYGGNTLSADYIHTPHTYWYPWQTCSCYHGDKGEKAIALAKMLVDKKLVKATSANQLMELLDAIVKEL